jgi:hypothetical protein
MAFRHQLWTRRDGAFECRIVGPVNTYTGRGPRGYLIGPAQFSDEHGDLAFVLASNRRLAPTRHFLTGPTGELLASFRTKVVTSPVDSRRRRIDDADGREIATLVPAEARATGLRSKTMSALASDSYEIAVDSTTVGWVGSKLDEGRRSLGATAVRRIKEVRDLISGRPTAERPAAELVAEIQIESPLAAAILVYTRFVLSEGRTPI